MPVELIGAIRHFADHQRLFPRSKPRFVQVERDRRIGRETRSMLMCCPASAVRVQAKRSGPVTRPDTVVPTVPGAKRSCTLRIGAFRVRPGLAKHSPKLRASAATRSFIVIPFVTPATPQILPQKAGNALAHPQNRCPHGDI